MTDDKPIEEMTVEELKVARDESIDAITDREVRAALVNHAIILNTMVPAYQAMVERIAVLERVIMNIMGAAGAAAAPKPAATQEPPVSHGTYL